MRTNTKKQLIETNKITGAANKSPWPRQSNKKQTPSPQQQEKTEHSALSLKAHLVKQSSSSCHNNITNSLSQSVETLQKIRTP